MFESKRPPTARSGGFAAPEDNYFLLLAGLLLPAARPPWSSLAVSPSFSLPFLTMTSSATGPSVYNTATVLGGCDDAMTFLVSEPIFEVDHGRWTSHLDLLRPVLRRALTKTTVLYVLCSKSNVTCIHTCDEKYVPYSGGLWIRRSRTDRSWLSAVGCWPSRSSPVLLL